MHNNNIFWVAVKYYVGRVRSSIHRNLEHIDGLETDRCITTWILIVWDKINESLSKKNAIVSKIKQNMWHFLALLPLERRHILSLNLYSHSVSPIGTNVYCLCVFLLDIIESTSCNVWIVVKSDWVCSRIKYMPYFYDNYCIYNNKKIIFTSLFLLFIPFLSLFCVFQKRKCVYPT